MGLQMMLIDALRGKKERKAMGPMNYRVENGHAVDDDEGAAIRARGAAAQAALSKALRLPEKTETMEERRMREMGL